MSNTFQSAKMIQGFSTCFRQWKAEGTHCKFLHGYAVKFKVLFEGSLDFRNWVVDFGFMKRSKTLMSGDMRPEAWFKYWFDHTVVIAKDDPDYPSFMELDDMGIARVRTLPAVGCEKFAEFVFDELNAFLANETMGRVCVRSVECFETETNSAIYTNTN